MKLRVWELKKKGDEETIDNLQFTVEVKRVGINAYNELYYFDKYDNLQIVCEIRPGIDIFEVTR